MPAFANIANDQVLPSVTGDADEYMGWVVLEDELNTSIDWSQQTKNSDLTALQAVPLSPLSQKQCTIISCDDHPFWLDTSATVHISPATDDFYTLQQIEPCTM
jgi:hypothetical protein